MKHKPPYVTSLYFTSLIRSYLKGLKTRPEILADIGDLIPLTEGSETTQLIVAAATSANADFYSEVVQYVQQGTDLPTREGLVHHLEAVINEEITVQELMDWAAWYADDIEEDALSAGIFEDFAVEFFCLDFLPVYAMDMTDDDFLQALQLFKMPAQDPLKEKIALLLIMEKEKQHFLFFLRSYLLHPQSADALNSYLMKKFGMDQRSFPYMNDLLSLQGHPEHLESLLKKAEIV
jgi:hypothetical protein